MKKIISLLLVIVLTATVSVAGTMAWLADDDAQVNTFTNGNVYIDLWEDFGDNSGMEKLLPATGSAQDGSLKNGVEKEVYVTNTGSEDAYVRVHIAIPEVLDDGAETFDASANIVHFNFDSDNAGPGLWDWSKTTGDAYTGDWNYYQQIINGIMYNVYVVTYESALIPGESTVDAIHQVYMDSSVTNEDIKQLNEWLGNEWKIYVAAEGAQTAGFDNAYDALNNAFGTPGSYSVDWAAVTGGTVNTTFVESNTVEGLVSKVIYVTDGDSLDAALETVTEDNEVVKVVMQNDITATSGANITGNIILDMNGHTISDTTGEINVLLYAKNGGKLTITGNGTVYSENHNKWMLGAAKESEIVIMNGNFIKASYNWGENCGYGGCSGGNSHTKNAQTLNPVIWSNGVITVYDGYFDCGILNPDYVEANSRPVVHDCMYPTINLNIDEGEDRVVIYGGTFVTANPVDGDDNPRGSTNEGNAAATEKAFFLYGQEEYGVLPAGYTVVEGTTEDGRTTYTYNYNG